MRPVNLIPPEQRRGERAPLRTGSTSYALVSALAVVLAAVTALVLTDNQIADRESEKASLEARQAAVEQKARDLAPYAQFASMQETRRQTVSSLAESRFDWERVLRELAIVLPSDIWLVQLAGTVTPEVQLENSPGTTSRASVPGPALELVGCGATQESVARFVAALEDIDGVTRVGVDESKRPDLTTSEASSAEGETVQDDCRTRDAIARFQIVAAFDAAVVPPTAAATAPADAGTETAPPASEPDSAEVAEATGARKAQDEDVADAKQAAEVVPGVVR